MKLSSRSLDDHCHNGSQWKQCLQFLEPIKLPNVVRCNDNISPLFYLFTINLSFTSPSAAHPSGVLAVRTWKLTNERKTNWSAASNCLISTQYTLMACPTFVSGHLVASFLHVHVAINNVLPSHPTKTLPCACIPVMMMKHENV
jgi:hypothetical protein